MKEKNKISELCYKIDRAQYIYDNLGGLWCSITVSKPGTPIYFDNIEDEELLKLIKDRYEKIIQEAVEELSKEISKKIDG